MAMADPGLMVPSPPGPGQRRFGPRHWPPDQPVQQPAHLGNRQRYQGFIPLRFSPFLAVEAGIGFLPDHHQAGMGQHGQGDVLVPALPFPHFILVQPNLPFGLLKALLDGPPGSRHPHLVNSKLLLTQDAFFL